MVSEHEPRLRNLEQSINAVDLTKNDIEWIKQALKENNEAHKAILDALRSCRTCGVEK